MTMPLISSPCPMGSNTASSVGVALNGLPRVPLPLGHDTMMMMMKAPTMSSYSSYSSSSGTLGGSDKRDAQGKKPKRMLNAYNFFFHHERLRLLEEATRTGRNALTGLTKHVADMWKTMDDKDKEPYQKLADEDKIRYQAEVSMWMLTKNQRGITTITNEKSSKISKRKREQDRKPVSPKRHRIVIPPATTPSPSQRTTATSWTIQSAPQRNVDITDKTMSPYQPTRREMKELADQLGHDGVDAVIRLFLH